MKSDKLDAFIKAQIDSLDRVKVPGTQWDKQASWDKIAGQSTKRKVGVYWFYFGGVAAILLMMISLWFFSFRWDGHNLTLPMASQNATKTGIDSEIEKLENSSVNAVAESEEEIADANQPQQIENISATEKPSAIAKQSKQVFAVLPALVPRIQALHIEAEKEIIKFPAYRSSAGGQEISPQEPLALNRTYIIRKKSESSESGPALTLSINMSLKSKTDPPVGLLSRLR